MSSIYIQEPIVSGEVILHTTFGEIQIELWCKEAPKACRNFIQLALENYYDHTFIHRIVPGFCIQGGDPSGTGDNPGESIYGENGFDIEIHSRLRFSRRGLLAMVAFPSTFQTPNSNTNDNNSTTKTLSSVHHAQFFITLEAAPELNRQCTIFGRVSGDSIFNVTRIGELETDASERPLYPPEIKSISIVTHPFPDIVPRKHKTLLVNNIQVSKGPRPSTKSFKKPQLRNLSFGDEEEASQHQIPLIKQKKESSDLSLDSKIPPPKRHFESNNPPIAFDAPPVGIFRDDDLKKDSGLKSKNTLARVEEDEEDGREDMEKRLRLARMKDEILKVKLDIKNMTRPSDSSVTTPADTELSAADHKYKKSRPEDSEEIEMSVIQKERREFIKRKRVMVGKRSRNGKDQDLTLEALNLFKKRLGSFDLKDPAMPLRKLPDQIFDRNDLPSAEILCALHSVANCKSCHDTFGQKSSTEDKGAEEGWLGHQLMFEKEAGERDVRMDPNELVVIDPREKYSELSELTSNRKRT